jgi:hypothetical protein
VLTSDTTCVKVPGSSRTSLSHSLSGPTTQALARRLSQHMSSPHANSFVRGTAVIHAHKLRLVVIQRDGKLLVCRPAARRRKGKQVPPPPFVPPVVRMLRACRVPAAAYEHATDVVVKIKILIMSVC